MKFLFDDVLPQPICRLEIIRTAHERCYIRHAAVEIRRTNGVADSFTLFKNRRMVLYLAARRGIRIALDKRPFRRKHLRRPPCRAESAHIEKVPCKSQIAFLAGRPVKSAEGKFDLFMPGDMLQLAGIGTERPVHKVCRFDGDIEKVTLARRLKPCDRRLVEMSDIVEFVA